MIDNALLSTKQAARLLGLSHRTLEQQRLRGCGAPYVKIGRQVRYLRDDLTAYVHGNRYDPSHPSGLAA